MAPRETENNTYAKFWGDKERALWYVTVFSRVVNCHKRGDQVTCKRARQTREEKTKREGGCMLTRLVYI